MLDNNIGNSLKEAVKQLAVFEKIMTEGIVNGENKMSVGTVNQFKGHGSRPVVGIFGTTGRAELRMTAKRNKLHSSATRAAIHGTAIRGIPAA